MCFRGMVGSDLHKCQLTSQVSADERNTFKTAGQSPSSARLNHMLLSNN